MVGWDYRLQPVWVTHSFNLHADQHNYAPSYALPSPPSNPTYDTKQWTESAGACALATSHGLSRTASQPLTATQPPTSHPLTSGMRKRGCLPLLLHPAALDRNPPSTPPFRIAQGVGRSATAAAVQSEASYKGPPSLPQPSQPMKWMPPNPSSTLPFHICIYVQYILLRVSAVVPPRAAPSPPSHELTALSPSTLPFHTAQGRGHSAAPCAPPPSLSRGLDALRPSPLNPSPFLSLP